MSYQLLLSLLLLVLANARHIPSHEVTNFPSNITLAPNSTTWIYSFTKAKDGFYIFSVHSRVSDIILSYDKDLKMDPPNFVVK